MRGFRALRHGPTYREHNKNTHAPLTSRYSSEINAALFDPRRIASAMSDPVSVSASIAGLVTLADILFSRTLKYVKLAKGAKEDIKILSNGLKNLSETLHILSHHTSELDADDEAQNRPAAYRPLLVQSCLHLLGKIRVKLDKHDASEAGLSRTQSTLRQLKWPFSSSEVRELVAELEQHKSTLSLALSADTFEALQDLMSATQAFQSEIQDIKSVLAQQRQAFDAHLSSLYSAKEQEDISNFFGSESPEHRHRTASNLHHPNTGLWLLQDDDFQAWIRGDSPHLWLSGIPGAGKTILASVVIEEAWKHSEISLKAVAYFYCDYKDTNSQDPLKVLGSLATQLAQQSVESFELLRGLYQRYHPPGRMPMTADVPSLVEVIKQMTMKFEDVFLVIDGLDECGKNTVEVTKQLRSLDSVVKSGQAVKITLLSRHEEDIRRLLEKDFAHVQISARSEDLRLYVAAEIETRTMDGRLEINSANLKEEILQALVGGAEGM